MSSDLDRKQNIPLGFHDAALQEKFKLMVPHALTHVESFHGYHENENKWFFYYHPLIKSDKMSNQKKLKPVLKTLKSLVSEHAGSVPHGGGVVWPSYKTTDRVTLFEWALSHDEGPPRVECSATSSYLRQEVYNDAHQNQP